MQILITVSTEDPSTSRLVSFSYRTNEEGLQSIIKVFYRPQSDTHNVRHEFLSVVVRGEVQQEIRGGINYIMAVSMSLRRII
jgi:hypothetical protein